MTKPAGEQTPQDEVLPGEPAWPSTEFSALLQRSRPYLKALAEREFPAVLRSRLDSSDVVQETLLRAFHNLEQLESAGSKEVVAWLRQVLRNQIIDATRYHRALRRDVLREDAAYNDQAGQTTTSPSSLMRHLETVERLTRAREQLPERYSRVIQLRQEDNLTFEEIGDRMQCSGNAARMLWGRAVVRLAKLMSEDRPEHGPS